MQALFAEPAFADVVGLADVAEKLLFPYLAILECHLGVAVLLTVHEARSAHGAHARCSVIDEKKCLFARPRDRVHQNREPFVPTAYEPLLAVDHPAIALLHRTGLEIGGVGAGIGFGHRVGHRPLPPHRGLQILLPLRVVATHQGVVGATHVGPQTVRRAAGLLLDDRLLHHRRAQPAHLLGHVHRPEPVVERLLLDSGAGLFGERFRGVDGHLVGDQFLLDKVAGSFLQILELGGQFEFQCLFSSSANVVSSLTGW